MCLADVVDRFLYIGLKAVITINDITKNTIIYSPIDINHFDKVPSTIDKPKQVTKGRYCSIPSNRLTAKFFSDSVEKSLSNVVRPAEAAINTPINPTNNKEENIFLYFILQVIPVMKTLTRIESDIGISGTSNIEGIPNTKNNISGLSQKIYTQ